MGESGNLHSRLPLTARLKSSIATRPAIQTKLTYPASYPEFKGPSYPNQAPCAACCCARLPKITLLRFESRAKHAPARPRR